MSSGRRVECDGPARRLILAAMVVVLCAASSVRADVADLQRRIDAAAAGEVLRVGAGVHRGPLVMTRPVTLEGEAGAIIEGGGEGDVVRIEAADVVIRGFHIRGTGRSLDRENAGITVLAARATIEDNVLTDVLFGVYLKNAPYSTIRNNRIGGKPLAVPRRGDGIRLWYSSYCVIEGNTIRKSRDVVVWFSEHVVLRGNTVVDGRYGLHFMYCDDNTLEGNHLADNSVGAFLMYSRRLVLRNNRFVNNRGPSGYGIGLKDMDGVTATGNWMIGNRIGIYFDNSPASVDVTQQFEGNVLAYNDIGLAFQPATRRNTFTNNAFVENIEQVAVLGSGEFAGNRFTVDGIGNFWSDYRGYDLDGDGVGDIRYQAVSLFENLMDREPKLRLFLFSPAQRAIELACEAVPAFRPQPKVTDTAPLMHAATRAVPWATSRTNQTLQWAAMGLALSACLLLGVAVDRGSGRGMVKDRPVQAAEVKEHRAREPDGTAVLAMTDVTKKFGRVVAVGGLSLELHRGEALALWGANGAGKTTGIRCVLGLYRWQGEIRIDGQDVRVAPKASRRHLGYVPQQLVLYDDWRATELLRFFARLKRVPLSRVPAMLDEVGLAEHARKRVGALSGGMKQRLALAVALLNDPPLLVLDEVTANLDADSQRGLLGLLKGYRDRGKAILFTSHRLEEVELLADRVVVMDKGAVLAACRPAALGETVGLRVGLRLWFEDGYLQRAVDVLREEGLLPTVNRQSLHVAVAPQQKARVLMALLSAGIGVRDFQLDHDSPAIIDPAARRSEIRDGRS